MIKLKTDKTGKMPNYQTSLSAGCDVEATKQIVIPPKGMALIPTGLYIDYALALGPQIPELQIRLRSSMAYKHGIMLANGVGTIDCDYKDEIGILLYNTNDYGYVVEKGQRIAQLVLNYVRQIDNALVCDKERNGGFGSTGWGRGKKKKTST